MNVRAKVILACLTLAAVAACSRGQEGTRAASGPCAAVAERTPAPALELKSLDGREYSLAELKGKTVVVDFWATWCPPCVQQTPYYSALRAKYASKGFEILGVNLDSEREDLSGDAKKATAVVRNFILANRVAWPNIMGGADQAKAFGVTDIPATFLVDKSGKIIHVQANGVELERAIADALK